MLSLSSIVRVRVNPASAAASPDAFSTGLILAPAAGAVAAADRLRLCASPADLLSGGFAPSDPAYLAARAYFSADPAPDRAYVGLYGPDEAPLAALHEILASTEDFYAFCLCDPAEARMIPLIEGLDSLGGRILLFCGATGSVSDALREEGLLTKAHATGSDRILTVYGADAYAAAALLGTAMGLSRANPEGAFSLCYRRVPGMLPVELTDSEVLRLKAVGCNVYITRGRSRKLLEPGSMVSGRRFDEVLILDRIAADLQEAAVSLLTEGPGRLPQTDASSAVFINRFTAVLAGYAAAGALAPGVWRGGSVGSLSPGDVVENGFLLWADSYDAQSDADRAARKAMPIHIALCPAGSVETLEIQLDVSL